jgi:hypothetical protein
MVLYTGLNGATSFGRCDELPGAVAEVERLRNEESIEDAKIYRLEEVKFEIKPYFRVELPDSSAIATAQSSIAGQPADSVPPVDAPAWSSAPAPAVAEVPSMMVPPPPPPPPPAAVAPMAFDGALSEEEDAGVGSRRGLFGR